MPIAQVDHRVALAVVKVRAHDRGEIRGLSVRYRARRYGKAGCLEILNRAAVVLRVIVEAIVRIKTKTFEMIVHFEVDDARDRVGAVHRGCAAGQNVDLLDEVGGNLVEVRA